MTILPQRKSIRLKNYDYSSSGFYYLTICTQNRKCLFGEIRADTRIGPYMDFNDVGRMINQWYLKISRRFENVTLDEYQIMPNHLHGIVVIKNIGRTGGSAHCGLTHGSTPTVGTRFVGANQCVRPPMANQCVRPKTERQKQTLFKIIQWFKTMTTNHYIRGVKNHGWQPFDQHLWQRNYWEHVVRTETDLNKIREYIKNNPKMWYRDRNNPKNWVGVS